MAAYKVINLDSPIESDYWVDIPVRDPATNKDAVDEEGRILVERHVTRSVKNEELSTINTAVETVNTLKEDYSTFKEEVSTKVNNHDSTIITNTNNITTLTESVNNHDLQINALYTKINAIQGIDIDDFKLVTETDIKNIKKDYLPLAGGTITGDVVFSGKVSSNSPIKAALQGTADRAIGDINNKALTSYIANLEVSGASVTVTNGAGETSNYTVDNINHAIHADLATNATSADSAIHATHADNLGNYPAADYVRSVNGVDADASGNIQLGNLVKSVNGVKASENGNVTLPLPFVKTVNSTVPDSNGNVVLDLSSNGGGVGFPDLSAGVPISNLNGAYNDNINRRTYTLPSSGWVIGILNIKYGPGGGCITYIYLNNVLLQSHYYESNTTKFYDFSMPLKAGTQITIAIDYRGGGPDVSSTLRFYPFLS